MSDLLAEIHPDRLALCFRTVGIDGLPDGLMDEPRFAARLTDVVSRRYALSDPDAEIDGADRMLAGLSREELDRLAARAGVVLNARQFLQEIRGPVLAALAERFGPDAMEDAGRHADLAADRAKTEDIDALAAIVMQDGEACLAAWIRALPLSLQRRVRLKWPNEHAVPATDDATALERGPIILRRLADKDQAA